jgi:hypothetical protein
VSGGEGMHPKAIEAAFSAPRLDLDALATVPPLPATVDSRSVPLPRDLDIGLDFTSDAVLAAGKVVQGFSAKGALADGVIKIDGVEGQLPGAGSFRVSGSLAGQDRLRFEGNVAANAANLRSSPPMPSGPNFPMSISTSIRPAHTVRRASTTATSPACISISPPITSIWMPIAAMTPSRWKPRRRRRCRAFCRIFPAAAAWRSDA